MLTKLWGRTLIFGFGMFTFFTLSFGAGKKNIPFSNGAPEFRNPYGEKLFPAQLQNGVKNWNKLSRASQINFLHSLRNSDFPSSLKMELFEFLMVLLESQHDSGIRLNGAQALAHLWPKVYPPSTLKSRGLMYLKLLKDQESKVEIKSIYEEIEQKSALCEIQLNQNKVEDNEK